MIEGATTFSAVPTTVHGDALEAAGYEEHGSDWEVEEREFNNQTVEVRNYLSEYRRTIDVPDGGSIEAGVFAVISSPEVGVGGEDVNPLAETSEDEIAESVQTQYEELTVGGEAGSRSVDSLRTVDFTTYEGEARLAEAGDGGTELDVFVDVSNFEFDNDHLVLVGIYPDDEGVPVSDERDRITALAENLERGNPENEE